MDEKLTSLEDFTKNEISIENFEDQKLSAEVLAARLRSYGKDNFPELSMSQLSHLDVIKEGAALHSLNLPRQYSEMFISFEMAKYFLFCDAPILSKLEDAMPSLKRTKGVFSENYSEIKKFYSKWAIEKTPKESEFYAISVLNLFERNTNKDNFLKYLYPAALYIYDKKFYSVVKAVEMLETAEKMLAPASIADDLKQEFLYLVTLYKGFAFMSLGDRAQAGIHFNEALVYKSTGITAQFYNTLLALFNNEEKPISMINSIINHDIRRLMFAVEINNVNLFSFFLRHAVSYEIFREPEFAGLLPEIRTLFESTADTARTAYQLLFMHTTNFRSIELQGHFPEKLQNEIKFIDQFLERYRSSKNLFVALVQESLTLKFANVIQQVKSSIKNSIISKKFVELELFDHQMREENTRIRRVTDDHEQNKGIIKKRQQEAIEESEKKFNDMLALIENKINSLETSSEYDPAVVFNNIMVYNVILSVVLFIIGGFIGSFSDRSNSSVTDHFGSLLISGMKWGGFVFIGGLIIAFISSASKIVERTNEKHRLQKKSTQFKNQKERALERINKEHERKAVSIEEVFKGRLSEFHKRLDSLKVEKEAREKELKNEAEKEIEIEMGRIDKAIVMGLSPTE